MRKFFFGFGLFAVALSLSWTASAQTLTLDIGGNPQIWTETIAGDPANCKSGGFWSGTYGNNTGFNLGAFKLSHNSGFNIYSYWGGFITGANGDSRCYNSNCPTQVCGGSGSNGWIFNQWGVMAGGGISPTDSSVVTKGIPYLIAYWDYFSDGINPNARTLQITLDGDSLFTPHEVYICNHPWPYYGNIYGDGFARVFNQPGDKFTLYIHAIHNDNSHDSIAIAMAEYDDATDSLIQSPNWRCIPLSPFGTDVKKIFFTMTSTDELVIGNTNYGPNTAVYFCLDRLKVTKTGEVASRSAERMERAASRPTKAVEVTDYFPVKSHAGGAVTVYDARGKEVLRTAVAPNEKINLSKLPSGEYRLQHGSKVVPITKKGGVK